MCVQLWQPDCFGRVLTGDHTYVTLDDKGASKGVMIVTTINTTAVSERELCQDREERTEKHMRKISVE